MNPDLLQQLRDIQSPADPSWWPPAPGWWLLVLLIIAVIVFGIRFLIAEQRRLRPWRTAQHLYLDLAVLRNNGRISTLDYLHRCNDLLRRLCVHGHGLRVAKSTSGPAWLAFLDQTFGMRDFSEGPGQVLAERRFAPEVDTDLADFDAIMRDVLQKKPHRSRQPS